MHKCTICGCTDFYKESGYFFCGGCQTRNEDIREELLDVRIDVTTRLRKTKIRRIKNRTDEELGWTSWELYNFVLIGLTNELIELGAPINIKVTVLQLWARYLGKLEVAFTSKNKKVLPKLARRYKKRDAEIIYGKVLSEKRARKRRRSVGSLISSTSSACLSEGSSMRELNRNKKLMISADYERYMQSQENSEAGTFSSFNQSVHSMQSSVAKSEKGVRIQFNSAAKKEAKKVKSMAKKIPVHKRSKYKQSHMTSQYKTSSELITPTKLWAILYLALRIHNQPIHLSDMLRYSREGHLSYHKLDHLIPPEVTLTKNDLNILSRVMDITHKGMRRIIGNMAKFLGVTKIICPDLLLLVNRYCVELNLPRGISLYGERLIALSPPKMKFDKKSYIPNYEGRAMAFIIVILKTLLALDGITEYEISTVAENINGIRKMFSDGTLKQQNSNFPESRESYNDVNMSGDLNTIHCQYNNTPCILVHGATENFNDALTIEKIMSCKQAASTGYQRLLTGASSVEAVEAALWWLECDEFFNCGYGSLLNQIGDVQMDACIIDGFKSVCGSVAAVSDIEHPISLARYILNNFPNSIMVGEGAKRLAKYAELNWLSKGNMISPAAYLTYKLGETGNCDCKWNIKNDHAKILKNSENTIGCVAYDGRTIAAGITSGGADKKLVGSVGGSSILGCNAYASRSVGCTLTGHGGTIMKLGLSRAIASDAKQGCSPLKALKKNLDFMLTKYNYNGGGVVFKKSGEWDIYFTSNRMPYAIIANDCVIFGAALGDKNMEMYTGHRARFTVIGDEGLSDIKLFNFQEWQRYIECRRTVLINTHFPTRLKYNTNTPDYNSLYIKFLNWIYSKTDRDEPVTTTRKNLLPRDLVHAMKQCITNINYIDLPLNEVNVFAPTLTPYHSYLQQLMENPLEDLPSILRSDFFSAKIGYMTKPEFIDKLALEYNVKLDLTDSNIHFIEKVVPFFEQTKLASPKDLKDSVLVQDSLEEEIERIEGKADVTDYLHKKIPCEFRIDMEKKQYYDVRNTTVMKVPPSISSDEFIFDEIMPDGKLLIPNKDNNDDSEDDDAHLKDILPEETRLSLSKFCKAYNVDLSSTEKRAILNDSRRKKKHRRKLVRNAQGKFIKRIDSSPSSEGSEDDLCTEQSKVILTEDLEIEDILPKITDVLNLSDVPLFDNLIKEFKYDDNQSHPATNKEVFKSIADKPCHPETNNALKLFRPFKDYWMYHCNFSRVKPKDFELFEKMLPRSFRWLLNECASIVEMSTEDLYEEVCLVEAYYANILQQSRDHASIATENGENRNNQAYINAILSKW